MADSEVQADPQAQAQQQTGRQRVSLRVDESSLTTSYTNAFRTHTSNDELIIDFGLNLVTPNVPAQQGQNQGDQPVGSILFKADHRLILNYTTAKRLALLLSQAVRQHEERFGEIKLNTAERRRDTPQGT